MNALEEALKLAKERKAKEAAQIKQLKEIEAGHGRDKKRMQGWIDKHISPVLAHSRKFGWMRDELLYDGTVIAKIEVKWTEYDAGLGETTNMTWCYRIWVNQNHSGKEEHFVKELAAIVSKYL